jgi:hypothetical protein
MALHKTHSKAWHLAFPNDTVPHSVTLGLLETQNTKEFLELLGFRQTAEDGPSIRMEVGDGGSGRTIDLLAQPDVPPGTWTHANGIHHHFAVATDTEGSSLLAGPHTEAPEADTFVHQPLPAASSSAPGQAGVTWRPSSTGSASGGCC